MTGIQVNANLAEREQEVLLPPGLSFIVTKQKIETIEICDQLDPTECVDASIRTF